MMRRIDIDCERWSSVEELTCCSTEEVLEAASLVEVLGKEELASRSRKASLRKEADGRRTEKPRRVQAKMMRRSGSRSSRRGFVWLNVPTVMVFCL